MNNEEKDYTEIDLVEVFRILRDNLRNIFTVMLCCVAIAAAYLAIYPPAPLPTEPHWSTRYRSHARVRIKVVTNIANFNLAQRFKTYENLMASNAILQPIYETLGIKAPVGGRGLSAIKDSEMATIYFDASEPEIAQKGAGLLVQSLQAYIGRSEQIEAKRPVDGSIGGEEILFQRVACELVDPPSLPTAPVPKPKPKEDPKKPAPTPPEVAARRTLSVSALLGFLLGSGYAVMYALMNRKITTRQDVEDYLGLPVLAEIPDEESLKKALERQGEKSAWQKLWEWRT